MQKDYWSWQSSVNDMTDYEYDPPADQRSWNVPLGDIEHEQSNTMGMEKEMSTAINQITRYI
ncbi:hypothetical protein NQ318_008191 [Aromia moschata]|uniref:Uncharacterized protein n=1 Tax=Aromia moschata TaxID=1265417 RepID=A0AAV8YL59_9CUCU|nr:hypothetical protein NQ318_008191 [Aromia moschata]